MSRAALAPLLFVAIVLTLCAQLAGFAVLAITDADTGLIEGGHGSQVNELLMGCYYISMTEINSSLITRHRIVEFLESQREIENRPSVWRPDHLSKKQMIASRASH